MDLKVRDLERDINWLSLGEKTVKVVVVEPSEKFKKTGRVFLFDNDKAYLVAEFDEEKLKQWKQKKKEILK